MAAAANILLVHGSDAAQRRAVAEREAADWSAAAEILLEKLGFLSFHRLSADRVTPAALTAGYDVVVVGRTALHDAPRLLGILRELGGAALVEGPLPQGAGASVAEPIAEGDVLVVSDDVLAEALARDCPRTFSAAERTIPLRPRELRCHDKAFDHFTSRAAVAEGTDVPRIARDFVIAALFQQLNVLKAKGRFAPDRGDALLVLRALRCALGKLGAGRHCERMRGRLGSALAAETERLAAEVATMSEAEARLYRFAAAADPGETAPRCPQEERAADIAAAVERAWDGSLDSIGDLLRGAGAAVAFLVVCALRQRNRAAADAIFVALRDLLYDASRGAFHAFEPQGPGLAAARRFESSPLLLIAMVTLAAPLDMPHNASDLRAGYAPEHLAAWSRSPLARQRLDFADGRVLARFGDGAPAIVAMGAVVVTAFPLIGHVVHHHTAEPLPEPYLELASLDFLTLERLVPLLIETAARAAGAPMLRLRPWPDGHRYCLTLRHDVDRIPEQEALARLMAFHGSRGLAVSNFWLPWRIRPEIVRTQEEAGQEVGLHSVQLGRKRLEAAAVARHLAAAPLVGEAAHGSASDYWLGAPSVVAAVDAGFAYAEMVPDCRGRPYAGFPMLRPDGVVTVLRGLVGITRSDSVDHLSAVATVHDEVRRRELVTEWIAQGGHVCLLNHPDINFQALVDYVDGLPQQGRLDWTQAQVATWWGATHDSAAVAIDKLRAGPEGLVFALRFDRGARKVVLALSTGGRKVSDCRLDGLPAAWRNAADGEALEVVIDAAPGAVLELRIDFAAAEAGVS